MAAGFVDYLRMFLGWKSVPKVIAGPYRVAAAGTFHSGAVIGEAFSSGADEAGTFHSGAVIGQASK